MAYKYSKGATVQGDIKAADDAQRDTPIDFGEDQIDFQTSGSVRLQVKNAGVKVLNGNLSFEDTIMAELSIPDTDLQVDTNAFTFNAPYALTFEKADLYLDQESSSENVTVTVKNVTADPPETIFEPSIAASSKSGSDTTATNASVSSGTRIRIAIIQAQEQPHKA